jgi:hypothetical protein
MEAYGGVEVKVCIAVIGSAPVPLLQRKDSYVRDRTCFWYTVNPR